MIREAAMLAAGCVLFINMGLAGEIQALFPFRLRILTCPKCLTFWCVLLYNAFNGTPAAETVAVSFGLSYLALWANLLLDILTIQYNRIYEKITENPRTAEAESPRSPGADNAPGAADPGDAMP